MRAISVVIVGLFLVGCAAGAPPKKDQLSGVTNSLFAFSVDTDNNGYKALCLDLTETERSTAKCPPPDQIAPAAFPIVPVLGAVVMAGVDYFFNLRQSELDAWKKAAQAAYSTRIELENDVFQKSRYLLAVRKDATDLEKGYSDEKTARTTNMVAVFEVTPGENDEWFRLTPIYIRAGRSVAATAGMNGSKATVDMSFALSVKGIVHGKAGEPAALKDLGSGTTTVTHVQLGAAGGKPSVDHATPTDMIPNPPSGVSKLSVTFAVSETGHPSDVDQLSAENKALQSAVGAVLKAAVPSK